MIREIIKEQMRLHNDNQSKLARSIGESQQAINNWFKSDRPVLRIAEKCIKHYNLSIVKILNTK